MLVRLNNFAVAERLDDTQKIKECRIAQDDRNRRLLAGYRRIRPELVSTSEADTATGFSHYLHGLTISQAGTVIKRLLEERMQGGQIYSRQPEACLG